MPPAATASPSAQHTTEIDTDTVVAGEVDRVVDNLETLAAALTQLYAQAAIRNGKANSGKNSATDDGKKSTTDCGMQFSETIARLCKYTDTVLSRAFGSNSAKTPPTAPKSTQPARERVRKRVVVKAEKTEATKQEREIKPFDAEYQTLQGEMRKLVEKAEEVRVLFQRQADDSAATDLALDKLEERVWHRGARARVRHIRFIDMLEEEWDVDFDSKCHCPPDPNAKLSRCCEAT